MNPQDPKEPTLEESVAQVMQALPPVIRAYIAQGKYTAVAKSLMAKYSLRLDQGGVLERGIMLLLMGINSPDEFLQALVDEAKLDEQTINNIAKDLNDLVFAPLRKEEEAGRSGTSAPQATKPAAAAAQPQPVAAKAETRPAPAAPPQGSLPPKAFLPQSASLGDVVRSVSRPAEPSPAEQVGEKKLLQDHEEPHIEVGTSPAPQAPSGFALPHRPEAPSAGAPPNLPGAMPPRPEQPRPIVPAPGPAPAPAPSATPAPQAPQPSARPAVPPAPVTSYSSDPYREPIDESSAT